MFIYLFIYLLVRRLVQIVGSRESISKAFAAIGKKIELVSVLEHCLVLASYDRTGECAGTLPGVS